MKTGKNLASKAAETVRKIVVVRMADLLTS
jgi:hypothetical protein